MKLKLLRLIINAMRLSFISLIVQCLMLNFLVAANLEAQKYQSVKDVYINLDVRDITVVQLFSELEEKTDFQFTFDHNVISKHSVKLNFNAKLKSVEEILLTVSQKANLRFKQVNNNINVTQLSNKDKKRTNKVEIVIDGITISGKVTSGEDQSSGLPGVNVVVKGTTEGTVTDTEGNYRLEVPDENSVLVFSSVGFINEEVVVGNKTVIDVMLTPDITSMDEIVVTGYGTVKKSDVTGAISSVNGEDLNSVSQISVDQIMQGRVPGVRITQTSAEPGGGFSVRIRGTNSITAGNEPLYVIDGLPGENPLNTLNPSDIESIEVLKDASATAIYGARGANGIVLITTKQGRKGSPLEVNFNASVGLQEAANTLDMMNAQEYMSFYNGVFEDRGQQAPFDQSTINSIGNGTNWQDAILQSAAVQDYRLSFSGGSEDTQYYLSLNYFNQDGIVINTGFDKLSGRINLAHSIGEKLKFGINLNNSVEMKETVPLGTGVNAGAGVIATALQLPPTMPIYDENGDYTFSLQDLSNSVALAETTDNFTKTTRLYGNVYVDYNILENLITKINLGFNQRTLDNDRFDNTQSLLGQLNQGRVVRNFGENSDYLIEFTAEYDKNLNDHSFKLLGGFGYQKFLNEGFLAQSENFSSTAFRSNNLGAGDQSQNTVGSSKSENTIVSGFARLNYNFQDRFLFTGTFRADGSSRFGENNNVAYFPSGALAWRISNESFFPESGFVEDLKLRASFGVSGNQEIGNGRSQLLLGSGPVAVLDGVEFESISPVQLPNPDLKWETTESFNLGLDMVLFAGRVSGSIEYFKSKTDDLLLELPVPTTTGFASSLRNVGDTENSGFEFSISSTNLTGSLSWTTDLNFATLNNKVTNLGELPRILQGGTRFVSEFTLLEVGVPMNSYYGYEYVGAFQSQADIDSSPVQPGSYVGGRKFKDVDGDNEITVEDRTVIGDPFPDFTLGMNNTFRYKGLQLDFFFDGRFGYELANFTNMDSENPIDDLRNRQRYVLDRWTPTNNTNANPSFVSPSRSFDFNSRVVESASFLRLRSLRLAYSFPIIEKKGISSLTIYLAGQNLFTITDYRGYNPDVSVLGSSNTVIDYSAYPLSRVYSLGVDVKF